ncbi:MAG: SDR family oxidoreductase [Bacteriovoracaceae bacterium]|nr:SDR family oxidoreductase [Bacteriovoracaceae bacterium]
MQKTNTFALVTGASCGIGSEFAKLLAEQKHNLVLTARNAEKLQKLATELTQKYGIKVHTLPLDLSQSDAPEKLFTQTQKLNLTVKTLINNAGFGDYGYFLNTDLKREEEMIILNILSLTKLTKLFAREMQKNGGGEILNVASTAAFQPGPLMSVYFASKAYVLSFTQALHEEFKGTNIKITALNPGPTSSEFVSRAKMADLPLYKKTKMASANEVAKLGLKALNKNRGSVIHGLLNTIVAYLSRIAPAGLSAKVTRLLLNKASS